MPRHTGYTSLLKLQLLTQVRKEEESKAEAAAKQQAAHAELSTSYRGTIRYKHAQSMPCTSHTALFSSTSAMLPDCYGSLQGVTLGACVALGLPKSLTCGAGLLGVLRMAVETRRTALVDLSLDLIQKLIAHGHLAGSVYNISHKRDASAGRSGRKVSCDC
jgi:hypothetical protein